MRTKPELAQLAKENYGSQTLPKTHNGGVNDDKFFEAPFFLSGVISYDSTAQKIETTENNFQIENKKPEFELKNKNQFYQEINSFTEKIRIQMVLRVNQYSHR